MKLPFLKGISERYALLENFQNLIYQLTELMRTSMDNERETLKLITSSVTSLLGVKRCIIFLYDRIEKMLVPAAFSGTDIEEYIDKLKIRPEEGIIGRRVFTNRKSVIVRDAYKQENTIKTIVEKLDIKSFIAVPLVDKETVIGVLYADTKLTGKDFSDEDLKLLTIFASFATISIVNARLIKELRSEIKIIKTK